MEMQNDRRNNFASGFLLGFLFGIILTILFTTKKGRHILRMLASEGVEGVANLKSRLQEAESITEEELFYDDMEIEPQQEKTSNLTNVTEETDGKEAGGNGVKNRPARKLFFKGIPRKSR
jgi:hypothetical protein